MFYQSTGGQHLITAIAVSFVALFFISQKGEVRMGSLKIRAYRKRVKTGSYSRDRFKEYKFNQLEKERLTHREIEDLMGCNRDTSKRVRGAFKRR